MGLIPAPEENIQEDPAEPVDPVEPAEPVEEETQTAPESELEIGSTTVSEEDGMTLVYVPEGEFEMGSNDNDDEQPVHTVWLDAFWIDQTEVTNTMYAQCVEGGNCEDMALNPEKSSHPIVGADWANAEAYCEWAGRRLPSEAEWEKAARGTDGRTYPWGNKIPSCSLLNFNPGEPCVGDTSEVGSYPAGASPYGALDMAGNAWEYVADWYDETYYGSSPDRNPVGPDSGSLPSGDLPGDLRVQRGGSYFQNEEVAKSSFRSWPNYDFGGGENGFRCAASP
jgi:serine/threonine-protein kinase